MGAVGFLGRVFGGGRPRASVDAPEPLFEALRESRADRIVSVVGQGLRRGAEARTRAAARDPHVISLDPEPEQTPAPEIVAAATISAISADPRARDDDDAPGDDTGGAPAAEDRFPYRLVVRDGLHAGAALDIDEGPLTIGGGLDNDLVLADLGELRLELTFADGRVRGLGAGADAWTTLPCEAAVGGVTLTLLRLDDGRAAPAADALRRAARAAVPSPDLSAARSRPIGAMGGAIGAAAAGLVLSLLIVGATLPLADFDATPRPHGATGPAPERLQAFAEALAAAAPGVRIAASSEHGLALEGAADPLQFRALDRLLAEPFADLRIAENRTASAIDAAAALRARLAAAGFAESLNVAERLDGDRLALRVSGALPADRAQYWTDIAEWYRGRYAAAAPLEAEVTTAAAGPASAPRIGLQAVWVGPDPYLIAADGRRSRPGDQLAGGWTIAAISAAEIRLERDGAAHAIRLAPFAEGSL